MPITLRRWSLEPDRPGGALVKNSPANAGDVGSIPGLERSPGGGNSNPLLYPYLENPMKIGAWQAAVHGVAKNQTVSEDTRVP